MGFSWTGRKGLLTSQEIKDFLYSDTTDGHSGAFGVK